MPVNPKKAKKPKAKTPKKKTTTRPQSRKGAKRDNVPPTNRNTNSVRVHIINGSDSGTFPHLYAGPNRSYFAFSPVFDMGLQKASNQPPINTGDPISAGPIKRAAEIPPQVVSDGLFNTFLSRKNSSMSMGSGLEIWQSSRGMQTDPELRDMEISQLKNMATKLGMDRQKVKKASKIQLVKIIGKIMDW
jgi:hypothetical protein